jgi:hypothetical protein
MLAVMLIRNSTVWRNCDVGSDYFLLCSCHMPWFASKLFYETGSQRNTDTWIMRDFKRSPRSRTELRSSGSLHSESAVHTDNVHFTIICTPVKRLLKSLSPSVCIHLTTRKHVKGVFNNFLFYRSFFFNATTSPVWTSVSPHPVVAEV